MVEVLIGDLPMDPKASTGKCAFCGPSGEDGVGAREICFFLHKEKFPKPIQGRWNEKALLCHLTPEEHRYANINCPQTWECESGLFFVHIHPFFILPPFFFSFSTSQLTIWSLELHWETSGGGNYAKATCMAYFYAFSFRSSEWVTLVCDLHSYRAYSVLYCEIKHCRSTINISVYIYMFTTIQYSHVLSCFMCI